MYVYFIHFHVGFSIHHVNSRRLMIFMVYIISQSDGKTSPSFSPVLPATSNKYRLFTQLLKIQSSYHSLLYLLYVVAAVFQAEGCLSRG